MMKIKITTLLLVFFNIHLSAQNKAEIITRMVDEVTFLSSDKLEGRNTGSKGEKIAADYISSKFHMYQLETKGEDNYLQYFQANIKSNPHSEIKEKEITGINVIGYIDNQKPETIIIGAHYDHVGYGGFGSLYNGEKEIHNGADDNASGVSILLNLANSLKNVLHYNYLFIAFSGEEHGLFGSSYYAKNPTINLKKVRFMINFDMVGRLNIKNILAVNGVGTSEKWPKLINDANKFDFTLKTSDAGIGPSDHTSFYLQNIPSIHLFTGQHEDYHKPSDDVGKINFEGMYKIHEYAKEIILLSAKIREFDFQETQSDTNTTPKFKVTLGVMPDYLYSGKGMRIDGVSKGKTANMFGILKGDVVVKIGEVEVKNMTDYMKGLSKYNKGEKVAIKIKRQEEILTINVVFQ